MGTVVKSAEKSTYEQFSSQLLCPVTLTYLTKAVSLTPCMHKINEMAARQWFGENPGSSGKKCPMCNGRVISYHPDHMTRSLAILLDSSKSGIFLPKASIEVQEESKQAEPVYPGKSAKFVLNQKWESINS